MIKITINGKKYSGIYSWSDMSLQKFSELASIAIPETYRQFILADGKYNPENKQAVDNYVNSALKIEDEQLNTEFPAFYRKVINCLTDIPVSLDLPNEKITEMYEYYFSPFIASIIYKAPLVHLFGQLQDYTPDVIYSFEVQGETYYLPETVNILGQDIPLANESIITYTEASDIFRSMSFTGDEVKKLALFMAIYCRKKGEKYNESLTLERKELFMSVPMSVVWSVFFCITKRLPCYTNTTLLFGRLPKTIAESVSEVRTFQSMAAGV